MLLRLLLTVLFQILLFVFFFTDSDALLAYHVILSTFSENSFEMIDSYRPYGINIRDLWSLFSFLLSHRKIAAFYLLILLIITMIVVELFLVVNHCLTVQEATNKKTTRRSTILQVSLLGTSLGLFLLTPLAATKSLEHHISKAAHSLFPLMAMLMKEWPESGMLHPQLGEIAPDEKNNNYVFFEADKITKLRFPEVYPVVCLNKNDDTLGVFLMFHEENWLMFSKNPLKGKEYNLLYTREYDHNKTMYCYYAIHDYWGLLMEQPSK